MFIGGKLLKLVALLVSVYICASSALHAADDQARQVLVDLVLAEDDAATQASLDKLGELGDEVIGQFVAAWRVGQVFVDEKNGGPVVLMQVGEGKYENLLTGASAAMSADAKIDRASRKLRKDLRRIVDLLDLKSPDYKKRIAAADKLGKTQNEEYLPELRELAAKQTDKKVKRAFDEAVAISELKNGNEDQLLSAVIELGELRSFGARDYIESVYQDAQQADEKNTSLIKSCETSLRLIDERQKMLDFASTLFRGLSTGSVLLLVAYGLAITFGQMGVINMAHGEFIAIGGYTVYLVQNFFIANYGVDSDVYGWYFAVSLPAAFIVSALAGALLEKGLIQFLYKRPLESLLATWAVSMVMQQAFRLKFGAANVSVSTPEWLSGSYDFFGVLMSYNRLSLIVFAILVVVVTRLLLSKTSWGLHVRATMQNRQMASSLGVPSARVNMLTFAFGSGLAGLAGAFLSQIGNVGPSMGQTYIVDSFMVVVVGGVGNLIGAAISSLGIGMIDQGLQPLLGPVMGKITVLFLIIIFLQFKPGGLFPARSRSLDD
ncbi:urea ABC transporter permease subunit UrtB [Persicirhabdus sediminis]|uniref:Urea ABC transporter permease subunit UrtB n=1 Tax=Persicirhabdus sediminis TaxID=454144 RepID=A0A8J7SIP8_9BACT|nr:urea ABC transporter permease subunit UrtB [Persicirhabdus sediminis]MBK1790769.1 urea ABC transporter permease subunit UrtB [Persicirhabdus sediminis]